VSVFLWEVNDGFFDSNCSLASGEYSSGESKVAEEETQQQEIA
jgi:hypothetical protein